MLIQRISWTHIKKHEEMRDSLAMILPQVHRSQREGLGYSGATKDHPFAHGVTIKASMISCELPASGSIPARVCDWMTISWE